MIPQPQQPPIPHQNQMQYQQPIRYSQPVPPPPGPQRFPGAPQQSGMPNAQQDEKKEKCMMSSIASFTMKNKITTRTTIVHCRRQLVLLRMGMQQRQTNASTMKTGNMKNNNKDIVVIVTATAALSTHAPALLSKQN